MTTTDVEPATEALRPLKATEARALKSLVENDFKSLANELRQAAADQKTAAAQRIRADRSVRRDVAESLVKRGLAAAKRYERTREALKKEARDADIDFYMNSVGMSSGYEPTAKPFGVEEAIRQAHAEIDAQLRRALTALERQRLDAQRKIMVAAITKDAEHLLGTLPSASDLMRQNEVTA